MSGPYTEAGWLGLLQGVTEFLPVSSSGHLALAELLFGLHDTNLALNVTLHLGTLVATAWVLRERLTEALRGGLRALRTPRLFRTSAGGQDALAVLVASVPTAVIGWGLRGSAELATHQPLALGIGFSTTALLLASTWFAPEGKVEHPSARVALLIGAVQGLAVLPGVSRSGATIAVALWLGMRRGRAFELSMLMSVPAVVGALLLEAPRALTAATGPGPALCGAAVACASGVFALLALRRVVASGLFGWFCAWVAPLAIATLALARAWPR